MEKTVFYEAVRDRLLCYAKIDTQSDPKSAAVPTTAKQFDLARMLRDELTAIGASDVYLDPDKCVVYAKLPSTLPDGGGRPVGFIAHLDTAPDAPGANVRPWVLEDYDGGDIVLNEAENIVMCAADFPNLQSYVGQDLVLTDGTTLLGGDDKAAIAAIMTMAEHYLKHPDLPHGPVSLAFTPDEEVGGLARDLDLNRFGADVAYTLDGDWLGYYEDETFNASAARLEIRGRSVHTGTAKGIMVNAADIACEFASMLPRFEKPQYTEGREGFFHVTTIHGTCEHAFVELIVRDHDAERFSQRESYLRTCEAALAAKYGADAVSLSITETYRSMKEVVDRYPFLIENLTAAIRMAGLTPRSVAFRGGTDGSALSHRGLPCPNLSAGYENAHGRFEYVPIRSMEKNVEILLHLCSLFAEMP
ncbi:MAG: peptidase T [Clostridia bacterium]|nr:peptidase T [Clostridia bacterium]